LAASLVGLHAARRFQGSFSVEGKKCFGAAAFAGHYHFIAVHDAYSRTFDWSERAFSREQRGRFNTANSERYSWFRLRGWR